MEGKADSETAGLDAIVIGRVGADLYPLQPRTRLEHVTSFERFAGGFAANVATGLARLGARVAIVSGVGDDGHGRFIRRFVGDEGGDLRWLVTHPTLRTPLAFCELWPPDHFPLTFYRAPSAPDWELALADVPIALAAAVPCLVVSGTGLARDPSRSAMLTALESRRTATIPSGSAGPTARRVAIFDVDWRPALWDDPSGYPKLARRAIAQCDIVVGGADELEAAEVDPSTALSLGARLVVTKRGGAGVTVTDADGNIDVPGIPVPVVNGLGAGDAFLAAFTAALLQGRSSGEAAARGNAAGAIVAARLACSAAMPRTNEIDQLLSSGAVAAGDAGSP